MNDSEPPSSVEPVFILAGQSNMAGRCCDSDLPDGFAFDDKLHNHGGVHFRMCWDNDSNFGSGGTSNGQWWDLQCQPSPGLGITAFGPELGIAAALGPRLFRMGIRRAHFIKFTMGSTNLHSNWNPANGRTDGKPSDIGHYARFIRFCKDAICTLQENGDKATKELVGMFWVQGESDSSRAKDANAYLSNFQSFILSARTSLGSPDLFVVVSPVVWHGKKLRVVSEALRKAGGGAVENCVCIEEIDTSFGVQGEEAGLCAGHLTAMGVIDVGRPMGEAFPLSKLCCQS